MITHKTRAILVLWLFVASAAFAASSRFVVITPKNEAEHPFLIQVKSVAGKDGRSRVRVVGAVDQGRRVWLIVCKTYVNSSNQNFRDVFWFNAEHKDMVRFIQLFPEHTTPPESGEQSHAFVEAELSHEQMRRAYIYIDYPRPVDDGGDYYSIDLAYYLDGARGKKSVIQWQVQ